MLIYKFWILDFQWPIERLSLLLSPSFANPRVSNLTQSQNDTAESRVTAIHFHYPTVVPVNAKWVIDLIPIQVVEGPVVLGECELGRSSYVHLLKEASVLGNFFGLLLLFRFD